MHEPSSEPVGSWGSVWLRFFHVRPPSSVRNAPTALMPTHMRSLFLGSIRIVCRHNPPPPANHLLRLWSRVSEEISLQLVPRSRLTNRPASSTPAQIVSGSEGWPGVSCQIFLSCQPVSGG